MEKIILINQENYFTVTNLFVNTTHRVSSKGFAKKAVSFKWIEIACFLQIANSSERY